DESAKVHLRRYARRSSLRRSAATPHSSRLASLATGAFANPSSKPSQTPANDGRINPAECKTVFKYRPDLFFDRLQDMLDTFAILRDILQIQSGIDNSLFHHLECGSQFYGARSAKRVPDISFQAAYGNPVPENFPYCLGFFRVPLHGSCCMGIYIINLFRGNSCL